MESNPNENLDMELEALRNDPDGNRALEAAALEYLQTEDQEYFDREFTGELDEDGYLVNKDGTSSNTRPSQNITGGLNRVIEMAKEKLG